MSSIWRTTPIILILTVLMMCFSQYSFLVDNDQDSSMDDGKRSFPDEDETVEGITRARAPVNVFFDGLESGDLSGGPWNSGTGWQVSWAKPRTGSVHLEARADTDDSTLTLTGDIDLSNYKDVKATFHQYTYETEAQDLYYFEVSDDGGGSWDVKGNWNGQGLLAADYQEYNVDLSAYDRQSRIRIRFRFTSSSWDEWWRIDDITLKATPIIRIENNTIDAQPREILRHNGTMNITGEFTDVVGHEAHQYKMTIGLRDPLGVEHIVLDNKTSGNDSLVITKIVAGHFGFTFNWTPTKDLTFGTHDLMVKVWGPNGAGQVNYGNIPVNITLLSLPPYFETKAVEFETEPINVMDYRGIPLTVTFHDVDEQSPDDYKISLILIGTAENFTVMDNLTNETGLTVSMTGNGTYEANYIWHPENALEMTEGEYRINLTLWETDEYLIDMEMFNISRNVSLVKKYLPTVLSLSCDPERLNVTGSGTVLFQAEFSDIDTLMETDFEVYLNIRDGTNNTIVLLDGKKDGQAGVSIEKTDSIRWQVTYEYEPPVGIAPGYYDLYFGVFDGDSNLNFDGFDNNTDKLFLYNNTSPVIGEVELSDTVINIFGTNTCRLTATFDDVDGESMGNFSANLSLKDPSGNVHALIGGVGNEGSNATIPYLNPLDATTYIFTYDIDPDGTFAEGNYDIFFSITDGWSGRDCVLYGEGELGFLLFYDAVPTPPSRIWPNSTADKTPSISWWGALDEEIPYEELVYDIQIGTAPGDDTILSWHDNGFSTSYQIEKELGVGVYYIQVRSSDGRFDSDIFTSTMTITENGNRPPSIPGSITPSYTVKQDPKISWDSSHDPDVNDLIEYFITIGTEWHGNDITKRMPTSVNTFYQFPFPLAYDTYYIQITATDGHEPSPIREQTMVIFDPQVNIAPISPTSLLPRETHDSTPMIKWEGAVDLNDDELFFWVQIGTFSGASDVMSWRSTSNNNFFQVEEPLDLGLYYVQVKCYDGSSFSGIYESTVRLILAETIVGPTLVGPEFTMERTPLINWSGAHYANTPALEENFSYYIRLGSNRTSGDLLDWTFVANVTSYRLARKLPINVPIYVQIKAFNGVQTSAVVTSMLLIGEFRLTVGFNETSYLFIVNPDKNQTIRAFIKNYGSNNVTIILSVEGTFSKYVSVSQTPITIRGGELITFPILIRVPSKVTVSKANSLIELIATSTDGSNSESSEPLHFNTVEEEKEKWTSPLGGSFYLLLAFGILGLTFILILLLLPKRVKRAKAERFDIDADLPENVTNVTIDEFIPPDLYSTFRFTERRGLKAMDGVMVEAFKKYGVFETAAKVKIKKKRALSALGDGKIRKRRVKALPPPAPGTELETAPSLPPSQEIGIMPPPPEEKVGMLTEGTLETVAPEMNVDLETPMEIFPPADSQDMSGFEYIPPERSDSEFMAVEGQIIDAEVASVESEPEAVDENAEGMGEVPEFFETEDIPVEEPEAPSEDAESTDEAEGDPIPPEFEIDDSAHFEEPAVAPEEIGVPVMGAESGGSMEADTDESDDTKPDQEDDVPEESEPPADPDSEPDAEDSEASAEDDSRPAAEAEEEAEPADDGDDAQPDPDDDVPGEPAPPTEAEEPDPEDEDDNEGETEDGTALDDIMNILGIEED